MDKVFEGFLHKQFDDGLALAAESDLFDLAPLDPPPLVRHYLARFHCTGLVRAPSGEVVEANQFVVGIAFPDDYLRRVEPSQVLTWLSPREVFHPNISNRGPFICVGRMGPGVTLVDLLYQIHEIITYNKATVDERNALNFDACQWARAHADRLPVDRRPLKRRRIGPAVGVGPAGPLPSFDGAQDRVGLLPSSESGGPAASTGTPVAVGK